MGMNDVMKKKAIKATSAKRSNKIVKRVSRADIVELNRSMEPIIEQNRREYIAGSDYISKMGYGYRGNVDIGKTSETSDIIDSNTDQNRREYQKTLSKK